MSIPHLEGGIGGVRVEDDSHHVGHEAARNGREEAEAANTHTPAHTRAHRHVYAKQAVRPTGGKRSLREGSVGGWQTYFAVPR